MIGKLEQNTTINGGATVTLSETYLAPTYRTEQGLPAIVETTCQATVTARGNVFLSRWDGRTVTSFSLTSAEFDQLVAARDAVLREAETLSGVAAPRRAGIDPRKRGA